MLTVFADVNCPFAYVGLLRLRAERDLLGSAEQIRVRAWPIELVDGRPWNAQRVAAEVTALRAGIAPELFAGFDPATFPTSSLPALNATAADPSEDFAFAIRRRLWEDGTPSSGPAEASPAVLADLDEGRRRQVKGSPHIFFPSGAEAFAPMFHVRHVGGEIHVDDRLAEFATLCARELGLRSPRAVAPTGPPHYDL